MKMTKLEKKIATIILMVVMVAIVGIALQFFIYKPNTEQIDTLTNEIESLADKKRSCFGMNSRITTLADISIYTDEGETKLKEVFLKMKEVLGEEDAPSSRHLEAYRKCCSIFRS